MRFFPVACFVCCAVASVWTVFRASHWTDSNVMSSECQRSQWNFKFLRTTQRFATPFSHKSTAATLEAFVLSRLAEGYADYANMSGHDGAFTFSGKAREISSPKKPEHFLVHFYKLLSWFQTFSRNFSRDLMSHDQQPGMWTKSQRRFQILGSPTLFDGTRSLSTLSTLTVRQKHCLIPICWATFCLHSGIRPLGPFSRKCAKSINQA